jgi:hypothetical protein
MEILQRLRSDLHLLCAANQVPLSYELTPANVADGYLTEDFGWGEAGRQARPETVRGPGLSKRGAGGGLIGCDILLVTERSGRRPSCPAASGDCPGEP